MIHHKQEKLISSVFLTFSGNCKEALKFYKSCFGGVLKLETFGKGLQIHKNMPVVMGSLVSGDIVIHGSDLVHDEGRIIGNYMAIFIQCIDADFRKELGSKLGVGEQDFPAYSDRHKMIEVTDAFDVRWILGVL